jgi:predicted nucleic acid-binding protein
VALIIDTGPLYAFLDRSDRDHVACRALLEETTERRVIPEPVLVEIDYWVHTKLRGDVFTRLLDDIIDGAFAVEPVEPADRRRIRSLLDTYADADIGYVDAAVLALTERLGEPKLATLDHRHFAMMRPRHVEALDLLPDGN